MRYHPLIALVFALALAAAGCTAHGGKVPGQNVSGASGSGANGATSGETANSPGGS